MTYYVGEYPNKIINSNKLKLFIWIFRAINHGKQTVTGTAGRHKIPKVSHTAHGKVCLPILLLLEIYIILKKI